MPHNEGTDADKRTALESIGDYSKLLITLATGAVALSATFLDQLYRGRSLSLLILCWGLLGASVVFGSLALGGRISQLAESKIKPRQSFAEYMNLFQLVSLLFGGAMFGLFAVHNVAAKPKVEITTDRVQIASSRTGTISVLCAMNGITACALTVRAAASPSMATSGGAVEHVSVPANTDSTVKVAVPAQVSHALSSRPSTPGQLRINAVTNLGQEDTVTQPIVFTALPRSIPRKRHDRFLERCECGQGDGRLGR